MLTLLSPAALWALAALALPLALHLRRQPPGTVRMGSLRFLRVHATRHWRELRWRELLLLAARLGLLAACVLLLVRLRWVPPRARTPRRWVLLDPRAVPAGAALRRLQALRADGYAVHSLEPGLPETTADATHEISSGLPDLWSLLREADATLPAGSSLAVFSPARFGSLRGVRPTLRSRVEWVQTADAAGPGRKMFLQSVQAAAAPGLPPVVVVGASGADGTRFDTVPPASWRVENREDAARLLGPGGMASAWVPVAKPAPLSVLILHDTGRSEDARYLAAAIRAAATLHPPGLDLRTLTLAATDPPAPSHADWTFWLSADPPPPTVERWPTRLFEDAPGPAVEHAGWIVSPPGVPGGEFSIPPVRLWRCSPDARPGTVRWTDESGAPLLTTSDAGRRWHFASRFHPDSTDLPLTTALPALMSHLLWPPETTPANDLRQAAASQAQPANLPAGAPSPGVVPLNPTQTTDLQVPLTVLTLALFGAERLLSHRRTVPSTVTP